MSRHTSLLFSIMVLSSGCGRNDRPARSASAGVSAAPVDSLALRGPQGLEVWFTLARSARAADGRSCGERGLEIRRDGRRVPVPLLYTGEAPRLLNDSTMRAVLWTDCHPMTAYRVNLRTGQPVREPEPGR